MKKTEALLNETRLELKNAMELLKLSSVKHNNVFLWRTDSFSEILKEAKNGGKEELGSDAFYTKSEAESFGYKLRVFICPRWGLLHFTSHLKLHSRQYIVDNTLFLRLRLVHHLIRTPDLKVKKNMGYILDGILTNCPKRGL